ncbi:MAG TPA: Na+/H+ antiporter NhaA [Candidatus Babeliaceae bacterium]|nr:Na+/H+ antiporter NhaA [Candidatus Babeliaceae bacterium]
MKLNFLQRFLKLESAGAIVLIVAAVLALLIDNSPLSPIYQSVFHTPIEIHLGSLVLSKPISFWINEGLMTLFFLLVGLELKREFLEGELAGFKNIILPGIAALGGMLIPALIYVSLNYSDPGTVKGWGVPVATDIAFALGALSLFSKRVPLGLKLFLMALAIFDDIGAIIIIAVYYHSGLSSLWLLYGLVILLVLFILNYFEVKELTFYLILGVLLWFCILNSGIHPTIAGVLLALALPMKRLPRKSSPGKLMEAILHPWVAYLIMPVFALANAGVSLKASGQLLFGTISLGIISGLVLGKQLGVFSFSWVFIKLGWAKLPFGVSWTQLYGVSVLCGIGFTMSLFLGTLAFENGNSNYLIEVRLGVLTGSILSGLMGAWILHRAFNKKDEGGRKIEA